MIKYFANDNLTFQDGASATISMKTWFYLYLLSFFNLIPFIGTVLWLVFYLWIGLRSETAPSIQNYIRLQLIVSVIVIAILTILIFAFAALFPAMSTQFMMQ